MSNMRMILLETAIVAGVLMTGLSVSEVAYSAPALASLPVASSDPRTDVKIDSAIMVDRSTQSETGETVK